MGKLWVGGMENSLAVQNSHMLSNWGNGWGSIANGGLTKIGESAKGVMNHGGGYETGGATMKLIVLINAKNLEFMAWFEKDKDTAQSKMIFIDILK